MIKRCLRALTVMALAALCYVPQAYSAAEESVNTDWLKQDVQIAAMLKKHLPPSKGDAKGFLRSIGAEGIKTMELGFGNLRHEGAIGGGYVSFIIKVLARGKGIASLRIEMLMFDSPPEVQNALKSTWGEMAAPYEFGIRYEYHNPHLYREILLAVERKLGKHERNDPTAQAEAYTTLTDPFAQNDVGDKCYYAGVSPDGRKAIEALKSAARYDLIRGALRSISPEGRVYAALALLELRELIGITRADYDAIKVIRNLEIDISTCYGCKVLSRKALDILP